MKKHLLRWISVLLALMIGLCAAAAETSGEEEDPVFLRVGAYEYPLSLAKYSLASVQEMAGMGLIASEDIAGDRDAMIDDVTARMIRIGVLENKLTEDGLHSLTEEENARISAYTRETYQNIWESFQEQLKESGYEADEREIMEWLRQDLGFTMDVVYAEAMAQVWIERSLDAYCGDVTISPAEVLDYLEKNYITPDREAYENNIPRYEEEILIGGNESFYTPEGYRIIRQIQLGFPEEIVRQTSEMMQDFETLSGEMTELREQMADAVIAGEDPSALREAYLEKQARNEALETKIKETRAKAPDLLSETLDKIGERLRNGEAFSDLEKEFSTAEEEGELYFHPASERWAPAFRDAAAALGKPGDVSAPVVTDRGVHLIQYVRDVEGGVHQLTEEEQTALETAAYRAKQMEALMPLIEEWSRKYETEIHPELLGD